MEKKARYLINFTKNHWFNKLGYIFKNMNQRRKKIYVNS